MIVTGEYKPGFLKNSRHPRRKKTRARRRRKLLGGREGWLLEHGKMPQPNCSGVAEEEQKDGERE